MCKWHIWGETAHALFPRKISLCLYGKAGWPGLPRYPGVRAEISASRTALAPPYINTMKHNENFKKKQRMSRTSPVNRAVSPQLNRESEGRVNDSALRRRKGCGHQKCLSQISCLTQKEFPDGQLIQKGIHFGLRRKLPTICQIYIWSHCSNIKSQGLDNSLADRTRHLWNAGIVLVIVGRVVIEVRRRICDSSTGCVTCYS